MQLYHDFFNGIQEIYLSQRRVERVQYIRKFTTYDQERLCLMVYKSNIIDSQTLLHEIWLSSGFFNLFLTVRLIRSQIIIFSVVQAWMKCFGGCFKNPNGPHFITNRTTGAPIRFNSNELEELRKKFIKVSGYKQVITGDSFKKNMGILGLHCANQFSQRLFNAFDIDNDGKISFEDFIEYMEILKCGSDKNKARISFKLIAPKNSNKIDQKNFMEFLNDFFLSWSSITNINITTDIKERTSQYITFLFNKVKKETGKSQIDLKYYVQKLYKDKDYMQSFEFITQGMADIFIHDKQYFEKNPEAMLFKIIKEIREINDTVFAMTNEQSNYFQPIRMEETPRDLPNFGGAMFKKEAKTTKMGNAKQNSKQSDISNKARSYRATAHDQQTRQGFIYNESCQTYENTKSYNCHDSRKFQAKQLFQLSTLASLQKKMDFIKEKIQGIVNETKTIYESLKAKFEVRQDELQQAKFKTVKNVHKRIRKNEGQMIFIGDDNWNLVLNMMIGIQMAVRSVRGFQEIIYEQPKDFGLKYYFELIPRRFGDEQYKSTIYSFTDYAPNTFNHIRKLFKIDNEDYIGSIGPNRLMASLMMGEVNSMTSLTSQGKSGSFFYYTADGKYMLKTIQYREYKFLRTILEDYYYYLKKNPDSMITKFYGLHKLIEKNEKGDETCRSYFVIMANVFNTKERIVQRYDIKGSWHGRENNDGDPSATKKDNDFKKRQPIHLGEQERKRILSIVKRDAQFFQRHDIIDYSLLIGVIKRSDRQSDISDNRNMQSRIMRDDDDNKDQSLQANRQSKVYLSAIPQQNIESYIFGIIDILTLYDSRKVFEYYFKKIVYGQGISAVPPPQYATRFVNFIQTSVFPPKVETPVSLRDFN